MAVDVEKVKSFIEGNLKDIKLVYDIASSFSLSSETLRKEFTRREKRSLHDYVEQVRIEQAKRLLGTTERRCFEICFEVGFGREDTGAKVFKRATGMTMEEYRLKLREGGDKNQKAPTVLTNQKRQPESPTKRSNR